MSEELKNIKKIYGEEMAHLCRELFPTILEKEGLLLKLLTDHFNPSRYLYDDIIKQGKEEEFKNFIYTFIDVEKDMQPITLKNPKKLLGEAGYDFYECNTEKDIQYFKKYYNPGEELCTFKGGRLNNNYVFFAVKRDVDKIKRQSFTEPKRQDLYGTSVISIQFSRGKNNTLSIKNRYNHHVNNPDATFSNNLDNIISGLTESFEREYNLNIGSNRSKFELNGYVLANDNRYYKYNYEINNIYYCPDNIIIDNSEVKKFDKNKYIIIDYFIIEITKNGGEVKLYDSSIKDDFINHFNGIDKVEIVNVEDGKKIKIEFEDELRGIVTIRINQSNKIVVLDDSTLTTVGDNFLHKNTALREIKLSSLTTIGNNFLSENIDLMKINLSSLTTAGDSFLSNNNNLVEIYSPLLTTVGDNFLYNNNNLVEINFPSLTTVGDWFLFNYGNSVDTNLPSLTTFGNWIFFSNRELKQQIMLQLRGKSK